MGILQTIYKLKLACRQCQSSCDGCEIREQLDELYEEYDAEVKMKVKGSE